MSCKFNDNIMKEAIER